MRPLLATTLALYLLAIFAVGVWAGRRVSDETDYLVAGRRLPLSLAWATLLATWFGAATVLGAAEAARNEGVRGTILDPFASGLALIVAGVFFARPLWEMRLLTFADFYRERFGPRAEVVASLILVPGYFGWIAAQYLALAGLQETFFGVPPILGIAIGAVIVLAYTLVGGMWSVTMTDAVQMAVVLVTLVVLGVSAIGHLGDGSVIGGIGRIFSETPPDALTMLPPAGMAAGLAWVATWSNGALGNVPGQDLMQRVFASRTSSVAVRACVLAGVIYIGFGLIPVGLGLASRILTPGDTDGNILAVLATSFLSPVMTAVFAVSLVSIIISTCTSAVLSPAAILGHNLLARTAAFRGRALFADRVAVAIVTAASLVVALSGGTILELLELSVSIGVAALFVPLVGGLWDPGRTERAAVFSMLFGLVVWFPRELMEWFVYPLSPAAEAMGMAYGDYVRETLTAERVGSLPSFILSLYALLPSAISGGVASIFGYTIGRRIGAQR